jgi:hypothetical protein
MQELTFGVAAGFRFTPLQETPWPQRSQRGLQPRVRLLASSIKFAGAPRLLSLAKLPFRAYLRLTRIPPLNLGSRAGSHPDGLPPRTQRR